MDEHGVAKAEKAVFLLDGHVVGVEDVLPCLLYTSNTTATSTTAMTMVSVQSSTERAKGLPPRGFSLWGRAVSSTASPLLLSLIHI